MMACEVCGKGMTEGVTLFRQNPKGEDPVMRCFAHNAVPIDPEVLDITRTINPDGETHG